MPLGHVGNRPYSGRIRRAWTRQREDNYEERNRSAGHNHLKKGMLEPNPTSAI
jgi:hypothetical protein